MRPLRVSLLYSPMRKEDVMVDSLVEALWKARVISDAECAEALSRLRKRQAWKCSQNLGKPRRKQQQRRKR